MTQLHQTSQMIFYLFFFAFMLSGCLSSTPMLVKDGENSNEKTLPVSLSTKLVVIPPKVDYLEMNSEKKLSGERYNAKLMANTIVNSAKKILTKKGYSVDETTDTSLTPKIQRLFRTNPGTATLHLIDKVCGSNSQKAIVAHYLLVKVGGNGTWNGNTGALTPNTNTTSLRTIIVDCKRKTRLWRNETFFRKIPRITKGDDGACNSNICNSIDLIYYASKKRGNQNEKFKND